MIGLRVPDAADDGEPSGVPVPLQPAQGRVESEALAEVEDLGRLVAELGARIVVGRVGRRDHGAEAVVAAVEGHHHQHAGVRVQVAGRAEQVRPRHLRRARDERGSARGGRQEPAPGHRRDRRAHCVTRSRRTRG